MARHSGDGPDQGSTEAVHHHIADVLPQGKAQGYAHGIDHPIKLAVEIRGVPGPALQKQILEPLLRQTHHHKIHEDAVDKGVLGPEAVQNGCAQPLGEDSQRRGNNALDHQGHKQPHRLPVQLVRFVDLHQQEDGGNHGGGNQNGIAIEQVHHLLSSTFSRMAAASWHSAS